MWRPPRSTEPRRRTKETNMGLSSTAIFGAAALACASALTPAAQAQDFFSTLFGGLTRPRAPYVTMPFGNDGSIPFQRGEMRRYGGGGQACCVRTCDGRHFPITASDTASR